MQPGDTIQPSIQVANFGTVSTAPQGPVEVDLVASARRDFRGASIIASFTIEDIRGLSEVPQTTPTLGDVTLEKPLNIATLIGEPVTLPIAPANYFLSAVVDPGHKIRQINQLGRAFRNDLGVGPAAPILLKVGPPIAGLPPAGVLRDPSSPITNPFPFPSFPVLNPLATTQTSTAQIASGLASQSLSRRLSPLASRSSALAFRPINPAQGLAVSVNQGTNPEATAASGGGSQAS
jgi:hypothetical protein